MSRILDVRDALLTVLEEVYHFRAPAEMVEKYAVWGEGGSDAILYADDKPGEMIVPGRIYYYTTTEYDPDFDAICNALTAAGVSWRLYSIGYDNSLGQIVYEITWEVPVGEGKFYTG